MNKSNNGRLKIGSFKYHTSVLICLFVLDFLFVCLFVLLGPCHPTQSNQHSLWFCCYKLLHQHSRLLSQSNPTSRGNGHLTNTFQYCGKSLWNHTFKFVILISNNIIRRTSPYHLISWQWRQISPELNKFHNLEEKSH